MFYDISPYKESSQMINSVKLVGGRTHNVLICSQNDTSITGTHPCTILTSIFDCHYPESCSLNEYSNIFMTEYKRICTNKVITFMIITLTDCQFDSWGF